MVVESRQTGRLDGLRVRVKTAAPGDDLQHRMAGLHQGSSTMIPAVHARGTGSDRNQANPGALR